MNIVLLLKELGGKLVKVMDKVTCFIGDHKMVVVHETFGVREEKCVQCGSIERWVVIQEHPMQTVTLNCTLEKMVFDTTNNVTFDATVTNVDKSCVESFLPKKKNKVNKK